ncbi:sporulation protein YunB [Desulfofarcimen acetoxidans DSM 771]|jgi:sporulation protein YunB|uniref:Sporulation protein YunB n=1 Tax=Desulfofarcimen acetoxidans (strain ATCC 49208 / DSM 771 / KCTC 5769 / VKM B-1644 / 5575) TaxID=485916 RepID=C8W0E3_DESAS|nr:sporulation protein YunB [Desulfofarcimen acetoxidans]ACV63198.1 sporulation protein YunB [Desulfofarcimen acetoxidans DSM 771]
MFKRRRPARTVFIIFFSLFIFTILTGGFYIVEYRLKPVIYEIAQARAIQLSTESVNRCIQKQISEETVQYQDFVNIHKDNEGRIVMMQANTIKVSRTASDITLAVEKSLEELKIQDIFIPIGQVSGTSLFANSGFRLKFNIMPVGVVHADITDKFEQAGINQTRHKIYLYLRTNIQIMLPLQKGETEIATKVPLAESIIVGQVPNVVVDMPQGIISSQLLEK